MHKIRPEIEDFVETHICKLCVIDTSIVHTTAFIWPHAGNKAVRILRMRKTESEDAELKEWVYPCTGEKISMMYRVYYIIQDKLVCDPQQRLCKLYVYPDDPSLQRNLP